MSRARPLQLPQTVVKAVQSTIQNIKTGPRHDLRLLEGAEDEVDIEVASISESEAERFRGMDGKGSTGSETATVTVDRMRFLEDQLKQLQQQLASFNDKSKASPIKHEASQSAVTDPAAASLAELAVGLQALDSSSGTQSEAAETPPTEQSGQAPDSRPNMVAVLQGMSSVKAGLRKAPSVQRHEAEPTGIAGVLHRSLNKRYAALHGDDDEDSIASSGSFESPASTHAVIPRAAAPRTLSPLAAKKTPMQGSASSTGSSGSRGGRRALSGRARRRLSQESAGGQGSPSPSAAATPSGRRSLSSAMVPLPNAMAMPFVEQEDKGDSTPASAAGLPRPPQGLLGAIRAAGGAKALKGKKGKKAAPAPKETDAEGGKSAGIPPRPAAGGLLGAIQSFKKDKLRKRSKPATSRSATAVGSGASPSKPKRAQSFAGALQSAAARMNKRKAAKKSAPTPAPAAAPAPTHSNPLAAQLAGVKLKSTGRRQQLA